MQVQRSRLRAFMRISMSTVVTLAVVGLFVFAGGVRSVQAKGGADNIRPGCGYGDTNHTHTGAPGNPSACEKAGPRATAIASADVHFYSGSLAVNLSLTQTRADCGVPLNGQTCVRYAIFDESTGAPVAVGYGMIPNSAVRFSASSITLNVDTSANPNFVNLSGSGGVISLTWTATSSGPPTTIGGQTTILSTARVQGSILGYSVPASGVDAAMLMVVA